MSKKIINKNNKKKIFLANIITLGNGQVGKTSLIIKYVDNTFSLNYIQTLGMDFKIKMVKLQNSEEIRVKLTDTAGQERFGSLSSNYLKKANGIILIYDITSRESFEALNNWADEIKEKSKSDEARPIILIGNKLDLEGNRCISKEEGENFAKNNCGGINFYETSCKNGENVENAINDLVSQVYNKYSGNNLNEGNNIKMNGNNEKKKKCC